MVLAAGENTRLNGFVPAFMKPLVLVNGRTLLAHALRHAGEDWKCKTRLVVASPRNVEHLKGAVSSMFGGLRWVLQDHPKGVLDALDRALPLITTDMVLLLCADNTFDMGAVSSADLQRVVSVGYDAMGVRKLPKEEAKRFTRLRTTPDLKIELHEASSAVQSGECWIGPLLLHTRQARDALGRKPGGVARFIELATEGKFVKLNMKCQDFGVPSELPKGGSHVRPET